MQKTGSISETDTSSSFSYLEYTIPPQTIAALYTRRNSNFSSLKDQKTITKKTFIFFIFFVHLMKNFVYLFQGCFIQGLDKS